MGKSKAKRFGSLKPSPTGLKSEKEMEQEAELRGEDDNHAAPAAITNIMEKLQGTSTEERACGCQLMASIVSQPKAIGYLLKENAVKITAPLFLDTCLDVRKSALGALRNMSVYGQLDVCEVMIRHDILTPLTAILKEYGDAWLPQKDSTKSDARTDVLVEAVELLSNLCESSSVAVQWFNKEKLLALILPLLSVPTYGYPLCIAVARCLHVVSENNEEVSALCQVQEVVSNLLSIITTVPNGIDAVLLRTLATGILLNLSDIDISAYMKGIITAIVEVLDLDSFAVIDAAFQSSQQTAEEVSLESEMAWPEVDKLLSAQGVSLELLANLCCPDDEWEDVESQGSEESAEDQAMETTCQNATVELCLPSEINSAFVEKDIISKILQKASPLTTSQISKLEESHCGRNTLKKLFDLQTRALLCLSNIIGAVDEAFISESTPLMKVWTELNNLASLPRESTNEDFKWAVTSALRAVMQRLSEVQASNISNVQEPDLDFLLGLAKDIENREVQINVVRIISTIGCIISAGSNPLLKKIGTILLEVACNNEDVVVVAEALDSLFDVFKEDATDFIAKEIGLVDKLRALQPSFKTRVSGNRKNFGENYAVVMMAKSNLAGFIKYKLSQT
ncbi:unnamed protein product [Lymnaea stagnalis]|uniref:SYO1-like TPR repeats domain-containing protein n=1 Tax=Lymnaea stagnalis TaxID=6523 RepID=A0AAV2IC27_LYMST